MCPHACGQKLPFFAFRDGLTISQVVACRCIRMFFYARAFGIHHLRMGRLARPSSKGCSKPLERAVREKLRSHSPNLSTSVPAHGAVACESSCGGCWAWIGSSPAAQLSCALLQRTNFLRDLGNFGGKFQTFCPNRDIFAGSESFQTFCATFFASIKERTHTKKVPKKFASLRIALFWQLSAPM